MVVMCREEGEEVKVMIWFERFIVIMLLLSLWILEFACGSDVPRGG